MFFQKTCAQNNTDITYFRWKAPPVSSSTLLHKILDFTLKILNSFLAMDFPYKTKSDVDRYASYVLQELCNSDEEKNQEAGEIGILYFYLEAYAPAIRYFKMYLSTNDNAPHIYQLLGQSYENLGMVNQASACYERSTKLNSSQPDLARLVCDLLRGSGMTKEKPNNEDKGLSLSRVLLQNLKEKIAKVAGQNSETLESQNETPPEEVTVKRESTSQNSDSNPELPSPESPTVSNASPVKTQQTEEPTASGENIYSAFSLFWKLVSGEIRKPVPSDSPAPDVEIQNESVKPPPPEIEIVEELRNGTAGSKIAPSESPSPDLEILYESVKPPPPEIEIVDKLCDGIAGLRTAPVTSDVEITWQRKVPKKDRAAAAALQLPTNFFSYKKQSTETKLFIVE